MSTPIFTANPRANYNVYRQEINNAIAAALAHPEYVLGQTVSRFEGQFAKSVGVSHCIGVNSGTDAIHLALRGLGVGKRDEVITVSHTAIPSVAAIEMAEAKPVLVDVEMPWFTISPEQVERCIGDKTRAVLAVHLYGQSADLTSLRRLCDQYSLYLIEDCAQAHGAMWGDKPVGCWGDVSCFSFYPSKNLGTVGDGGAVLTSHETLADKVRSLRQYGWDERKMSAQPGWNSRLGPLEAAILEVKLRHLSEMTSQRKFLATRYDTELDGLPLSLPQVRSGSEHVFHLYVVMCKDQSERDGLVSYLKEGGIFAGVHYDPPVHLHPAYQGRIGCNSLEITEGICGRIISLPLYPELAKVDQDRIILRIKRFYK